MKSNTVQDILSELSMFDSIAFDIENKYAVSLPMEVKMLLKNHGDQFIPTGDGEHYRILSKDEMMNTERHLGLDCVKMGVLPLVDCKDNNFLVYKVGNNCFEMINIVDGNPYDSYLTLIDFWKDLL